MINESSENIDPMSQDNSYKDMFSINSPSQVSTPIRSMPIPHFFEKNQTFSTKKVSIHDVHTARRGKHVS